ncbi:MAG TPA: hypothetical protein VEC75_05425, partial [Stellaceae bacterium]|nr:hypothetical protein [Stellaceae bacterium]
ISFLVDFRMPLQEAFTTPRIDASEATVACDSRLDPEILAALKAVLPAEVVENTVYPGPFAMPSGVSREFSIDLNTGATFTPSPAAAVAVEPER